MRMDAMKNLPESVGIRLRREIASDEDAIREMIITAEHAVLAEQKIIDANVGPDASLSDAELRRLRKPTEDRRDRKKQIVDALNVYYKQTVALYYATGGVDTREIKHGVLPEISALEHDIQSTAIIDSEQKKPFVSILRKAHNNATRKASMLGSLRSAVSRIISSDVTHGILGAAATKSPLVGVAIMALGRRPAHQTRAGYEAARAQSAAERGQYRYAEAEAATPVPPKASPTTTVPRTPPAPPAPPSMGYVPPAGATGASSMRNYTMVGDDLRKNMLRVLQEHTGILYGILNNTTDINQTLKDVAAATELMMEERAFETRDRSASDGSDDTSGRSAASRVGNSTGDQQSNAPGMLSLLDDALAYGALGLGLNRLRKVPFFQRHLSRIPGIGRWFGAPTIKPGTVTPIRRALSYFNPAKLGESVKETASAVRSPSQLFTRGGASTFGRAATKLATRGALPMIGATAEAYNRKQEGQTNTQAAAGTAGSLIGAALGSAASGAAMGTIFPGAGNFIGGIVGLLAGTAGYIIGGKVADKITGVGDARNTDTASRVRPPDSTTPELANELNDLIKLLEEQNITDSALVTAIIGNVLKESNGRLVSEGSYRNTSAEDIKKRFSAVRGMTNAQIDQLKQNDKEFFDTVYANIGGYDYRGRGYIQLTGKSNYEHYGKKLGVDLVNNPDLALSPEIAKKIAVAYMVEQLPAAARKHQMSLTNLTPTEAALIVATALAGTRIDPGKGFLGTDNLNRAVQETLRMYHGQPRTYTAPVPPTTVVPPRSSPIIQNGDAAQVGRKTLTHGIIPQPVRSHTTPATPVVVNAPSPSIITGSRPAQAPLPSPTDQSPLLRYLVIGM